jgi:hypothetical protein
MKSLSPESRTELIDRLVLHCIDSTSTADLRTIFRQGVGGFEQAPDDQLIDLAAQWRVRMQGIAVTESDAPLQDYLVSWELNIRADGPASAARVARYFQMPGTNAETFDITDQTGHQQRVNLAEDRAHEGEGPDRATVDDVPMRMHA